MDTYIVVQTEYLNDMTMDTIYRFVVCKGNGIFKPIARFKEIAEADNYVGYLNERENDQ